MPINAEELPNNTFIEQNDNNFYSLATNPDNSQLLVSDALNYTQQADVFIFSSQAEPIDTLKVGIIPGFFCFKY